MSHTSQFWNSLFDDLNSLSKKIADLDFLGLPQMLIHRGEIVSLTLGFSSFENILSKDNSSKKVTRSCSTTQTQGSTGCWLNLARNTSSSTQIPNCNAAARPSMASRSFRASHASPAAANTTKRSAARLWSAICVSLPLYGISTTNPMQTALVYIATPALCNSCALSRLPVWLSKNMVIPIASKKNGNVYVCKAR